ncbi:hypothetical protein HK099_000464 [Clydaea vesicula]|uniref:Alginate lyase 2 domain-containing protein n=1 Tax=Clydaea vesicula TaxID=447962 RepID=A0AAD5TUQ5_9FUNG|nr:hypothetical protein HK099_000464 [Clydaea vesicula]
MLLKSFLVFATVINFISSSAIIRRDDECDGFAVPGSKLKCKFTTPSSEKGNYLRIYKNGDVDATADRSVRCPSENGEVSLTTTESDSGLWTVDLVNMDTWTVPATQTVELTKTPLIGKLQTLQVINVALGFGLKCDASVESGYNINYATAVRNVRCPLDGTAVSLVTEKTDNGTWTIDMVNIDTWTVPVNTIVSVTPRRWKLQCTSSGNGYEINCSYETRGAPNNNYIRIHQNHEFEKTEDRNVRCVEISGVVKINVGGLTGGTWIVEMVNLGSGVAVFGTTYTIPVTTSVDLKGWNLHLPVATSVGKITVIEEGVLYSKNFSYPPYFQVDTTYTLRTPVWFDGAASSSVSNVTGTELTEIRRWTPQIRRFLSFTGSINHTSEKGVVVAQIVGKYNGKDTPVIYVTLQPNAFNSLKWDLLAFVDEYDENNVKFNTITYILKRNYVFGATFQLKLNMVVGKLEIFYNGVLQNKDYNFQFEAYVYDKLHFRVGVQNLREASLDANVNKQVSEVTIYSLSL